ncbi:SMI1/KNR4 family protein [Clostridium lacusfryxellense]|uniref:SMI1/KNR4 family protein n=1 Tax=Clostridium lacusfryxellense TaxID=205328 RepID=UPI001C0C1247|nr:SMI1/KNR4 family protein [Clostridium lacusfryxellense]MBU3113156.1 SMI1/KNR4 family protein [Clostridium lacusfryxellense]
MKTELENLKDKLFATEDGSIFWKLTVKLIKKKKKDRKDIIEILGEYVKSGNIFHMRSFILPDLIELVNEGEGNYSWVFDYCLTDKDLAYWGIEGLLKTEGLKAYGTILSLVDNINFKVEVRAKAIKQLAIYSGQKFDRNLSSDPGHWKLTDLRVAEVIEWANQGFPQGEGYKEPQRHPSLDNPSDELEIIVSALDKKLAKQRKDNQDLASPTNWLTECNTEELNIILDRWVLPSLYSRFLRYYSPLNVFIEGRKFLDGLELFGVSELIHGQIGYSYDEKEEAIPGWPTNFLVLGNDNADPFCLDLSKSNGEDAPIVKAIHGEGEWKFKKYAPGLKEFLQKII